MQEDLKRRDEAFHRSVPRSNPACSDKVVTICRLFDGLHEIGSGVSSQILVDEVPVTTQTITNPSFCHQPKQRERTEQPMESELHLHPRGGPLQDRVKHTGREALYA